MPDYPIYQSFAVDEAGNVRGRAYVEVTSETTGLLSTIYSGRTGGALANPFQADSDGYFKFFAVGDFYKIRVYEGPSLSPTYERIFRYVPLGLAQGYDIDTLMRLVPDGTVGAPGLAFLNDQDTGLYRIGSNNIGIAVGGAKIVDIASTLVSIVAAAALSVLSTTASTSSTTGALKVAGGAGIAGALNVAGNSTFGAGTGASTSISIGPAGTGGSATGQAILNFEGGSGTSGGGYSAYKRNSTVKWYIGQTAPIQANTSDDYEWYANGTAGTALKIVHATGVVSVPLTTASTSTTTGALVVGGGIGVAGRLNTGGALNVASGGAAIVGTGAIVSLSNASSNVNTYLSLASVTASFTCGVDTDNLAYFYTASSFKLFTNGVEHFRFHASGGLSINSTTDPGAGGLLATAATTVASSSASSLAVGLNGATNPAFQVDSSAASQAAGFKITGAATGGTVALAAIDSGGNTNVTLNAKGTGTIGIGSVSTGAVTITPATNIVGETTVRSTTATPAAGSTSARLLFGTTAGFGIYYGSGAPTVSAAQGSIYLRSDGSSTSTRLYVNTTGSTTWTNLTSAA